MRIESWRLTEFQIVDGMIRAIFFKDQPGKPELSAKEKVLFQEIVNSKQREIVDFWIGSFIWHKSIECSTVTKRLK